MAIGAGGRLQPRGREGWSCLWIRGGDAGQGQDHGTGRPAPVQTAANRIYGRKSALTAIAAALLKAASDWSAMAWMASNASSTLEILVPT